MDVVEKIKATLAGTDGQTYNYRCQECEHEFESTEHNPNFTECPECGGDRIHTAV